MDTALRHPLRARLIFVVAAAMAVSALVGCTGTATPADGSKPSEARDQPIAQLDPATQQDLDTRWADVISSHPDAVRPTVRPEHYVQADDWPGTTETCMHDLGFLEVVATPDGGVESGPIPEGQESAFAVAMYTCAATFPLDPKYSVPLTDERLEYLYAYFKDDLAPCLEAEGFSVPKAPSRDVFIESYATTGGWNLYEEVNVSSQDEWYAINEKCPQTPADLYQ